jgi:transcriptional regulator GlxA family with amidase domain
MTPKDPATAPVEFRSAGQADADRRFHFVLLPGFWMLSLVPALDTLVNANLLAGRTMYDWVLCSQDGQPVASTQGTPTPVDFGLDYCGTPTDIVIVAGTGVEQMDLSRLSVWLGRKVRGDVRVAGLGSAAFVMARANLLNDVPATMHWHYRDSFAETFPEVELSSRPYISEGNRLTSSGGVTSIDLFLDLIAQDHGVDFSIAVADSMNYQSVRQVQQSLRVDAPSSLRVTHPKLTPVLQTIEQNLEFPVPPSELAGLAGVSTRQLERLFRQYLGQTPKQYYMSARLRRAHFLLAQTQMSVMDVALACGFQSANHFAKCFRLEFGQTPAQMRRGKSAKA